MVLKVYKYLCVHFHCYGISVIKSYFFCCYKSNMWWFLMWYIYYLFMLLYNFLKHLKNVFPWDFWELCVYMQFSCVRAFIVCVLFVCFFWGGGGVTSFHCRRISGPLSRVILPGPDLPYPLGNSSWLPCQRYQLVMKCSPCY